MPRTRTYVSDALPCFLLRSNYQQPTLCRVLRRRVGCLMQTLRERGWVVYCL